MANSEAKHTPGPWEVATAGSGTRLGGFILNEYFVRRPGDDVAIAADIVDPETSTPCADNARLIGAAPDLLEALQEAVALADKNVAMFSGKPNRTPRCQASYDKCVAAIQKATGEQA